MYIWATVTNNSTQKQNINLYRYIGSSSCFPTIGTNEDKYYPATTCAGALKESWTPTFSSSTTATPLSIILLPGKTVQVRVGYMKFTSNTYVHFAVWLNGKKYSTTVVGADNGCDELSKTNNYDHENVRPISPDKYGPNLAMTYVKLCSDEAGTTEYPKDSNGVYKIPQGDTVHVFYKWKNTSSHWMRYAIYDILPGGSFGNPLKTGPISGGSELGWIKCTSFTANSLTTVTREGHVYQETTGQPTADDETNANDNVITYQYKAIPKEVTVTFNHYLMNADGSTYTYQESSYATINTGTTITAANYKKSYSGFDYSYAQLDYNNVTTVYIDRAKTINLYYSRKTFTVTLYNGTGISGTTGGGTYYYGATVNIDATVATGYHWVNWTGTDTLTNKAASFTMPMSNVTLTANAAPNTITFKYYSNYANTLNGNAINSEQQVNIVDWTVAMNDSFPQTHWDYTGGSYSLYRNRWYATGYWGTAEKGGILAHESSDSFANYQAICTKYGVDINTPHTTINIYAQWEPHYDVELYDIFFKAYDSNGNLYTLTDTQQQNIPIGTKVYVYYTYRNRSPVAVNITGYNTNGAAISYNGSTTYSIPGWDATLTIPAGSFTATPLGQANMSGSVYINGLDVSKESTDLSGVTPTTNNTKTESYHVKFDVEIVDIYFTDYEGNFIDMGANIPVNSEVVIHHVYRNNSSEAYTVNGYDDAGNKITYNGTQKFTIPAYGTIDIIAGEMRTPSEPGAYSINGAVYRDGYTAATEKDEWDLDNNVIGVVNGVHGSKDCDYSAELGPYLTPIAPNAAYREGTDVITSFYVYNPTANNYTPDSPILVRIKIYDTYSGNLITEMTQTTVCPANAILTPENGGDPNSMAQIVYFKWNVPHLDNFNDIKIVADLDLPEYDYWWGRVSRNYDYGIWGVNYTPDTDYEDKQPAGWTRPGSVADAKGNAIWGVWEYVGGAFVYQYYGVEATGRELILTPQSKTAYKENYMWYMKSGYGFTAEANTAKIGKYGGTASKKPGTDAYTGAQYAYMYYPEFQYQISSTTTDTMENVDGKWQLFEFLDYGRVHFTPIWYPDGVYDAVMVQSDIWTPMGMLTTQKVASVVIEGDLYDDWYIQGT